MFVLTKESIRLSSQWARYSNNGHLHTEEAKNPGTAESARLVLKARGTHGEPLLFSVSRKVERVLMSKKKGSSSRIDALTARSAVQADRQEWPAFLWDSSAGLLLPGAALRKVTTKINPHSCEMLGSSCHLPYCWDTHIRISGGNQTLCVKGLTMSGAHRAEAGTVLPLHVLPGDF